MIFIVSMTPSLNPSVSTPFELSTRCDEEKARHPSTGSSREIIRCAAAMIRARRSVRLLPYYAISHDSDNNDDGRLVLVLQMISELIVYTFTCSALNFIVDF